jgi:hypothetical protein
MAKAKDLEILSVELRPPQPRGKPNLETGEVSRWIDITITVKNNTAKKLFVMASVRQLRYDSALNILHLGLYEPQPASGKQPTQASFFKLPNFVTVPKGATASINVSVPEVINFINPLSTSERGPTVTSVDISGLQRIQLTIAYNDKPFEIMRDISADELRRQLPFWGQTIQRTLTALIPTLPRPETK